MDIFDLHLPAFSLVHRPQLSVSSERTASPSVADARESLKRNVEYLSRYQRIKSVRYANLIQHKRWSFWIWINPWADRRSCYRSAPGTGALIALGDLGSCSCAGLIYPKYRTAHLQSYIRRYPRARLSPQSPHVPPSNIGNRLI